MEAYAADVKSKSYKLTKLDTMLSITNARFVFFYENKESSGTFMPSDKLKKGFFRTLVKFPWLLGFLKQTSNGLLEIVVDKGHLNTPIYRETQSDVHFRDIKAADYNPKTWPKNVVPLGRYQCPEKETKEIKLANFHVVRFRDNSGIVISANHSHAVADGASSFAFFNHWADETRALIAGNQLKEVEYCFDPDILLQQLPRERVPLNETSKKMYSFKSYLCESIMKLAPNTRGKLLRS
ncbi:hypothetical protein FBU59_004692 [Linderina macrospora]|uniref:Uncharacterized protein n=1 Tax=Linderina macrospora TaxID=4868 RepID=A0ACC1J527_9FUNG|nr:hypothetical protein FBU59_004692 [Linderina macrospora]